MMKNAIVILLALGFAFTGIAQSECQPTPDFD